MTVITLTQTQQVAVDAMAAWIKAAVSGQPVQQEFYLAGLAGTGKSTIIQFALKAANLDESKVQFCAFTGKASLVMTLKSGGRYVAETLHRAIYKPVGENDKGDPVFKVKPSEEVFCKLFVVDEASMVSVDMLNDLRSFGIPTLFVGDFGQLPPVGNVSEVFDRLCNNPDVRLTEVLRQNAESAVLRLADMARNGARIPMGFGNGFSVRPQADVYHKQYVKTLMQADQVICAKNATRKAITEHLRREMGFDPNRIVVGDKLICRENNWENFSTHGRPLVNGVVGRVLSVKLMKSDGDYKKPHYLITIRPDYASHGSDETFECRVIVDSFHTGIKPKHAVLTGGLKNPLPVPYSWFEYGYAITCHSSQGSEWKNVVVYAEHMRDTDHRRWLYTAITRASEKIELLI